MAVAAPSDRRFRRAHLRPSRRRSPWASRTLVFGRAAIVVVALGGTAWYAAHTMVEAHALHVSEIQVRGNRHLARGEVMALLSGLEGQHILLTDLEPWRRRVLGSPWVQRAALRRVLPSTVEVVIGERTPIAIGRIDGELYLVDEEGLVIDAYGANYAQFDLPIVDGLASAPDANGPTVDPARAALAARLLSALEGRRDLMRRVSQVDVSNFRDAVVLLDEDPALVHLGDQRFVERLQSYLDLAEALRARVPEIEYVDLRFEDRVYVRPARTSTTRRAGTTP